MDFVRRTKIDKTQRHSVKQFFLKKKMV